MFGVVDNSVVKQFTKNSLYLKIKQVLKMKCAFLYLELFLLLSSKLYSKCISVEPCCLVIDFATMTFSLPTLFGFIA